MIQRAAAMGTWWLAASLPQCACSCTMSGAEFFGKRSNHLGDSVTLQPRFGALWLLAFPKTKITFEREEISDHGWDSGKYDGAADGDWENCRSKVPTMKGAEASLFCVQCFLYLASSINYSIFTVHGWILSGQTSYKAEEERTTKTKEERGSREGERRVRGEGKKHAETDLCKPCPELWLDTTDMAINFCSHSDWHEPHMELGPEGYEWTMADMNGLLTLFSTRQVWEDLKG